MPSSADTNAAKQNWLLKSEWGCLNNAGEFLVDTQCPDPAMSNGRFRTKLPVLRETGFLAFVNERGSKAINIITGVVQPIDMNPTSSTYGEAIVGDKDRPARRAYCATLCNNFTTKSDDCFSCVADRWASDRSLYPELPEPVPASTIKEAVKCASCIASRVSGSTNQTEQLNAVWDCLNGASSGPALANNQIVMIVILSVVFLVNVIGLIVWLVMRPKSQPDTLSFPGNTDQTISNEMLTNKAFSDGVYM